MKKMVEKDGWNRPIESARLDLVDMNCVKWDAPYPEPFNFREMDSLGWQLVCLLTEQLEGQIQLNSIQGSEVILTFKELDYQKRL